MSSLFPLATFESIKPALADDRLSTWGHYLGPCERPFGRQDFGLFIAGALVSVAVSASTVSATCDAYSRFDVVELVRLVTDPSQRWATRVTLRFWRQLAPAEWAREYAKNWSAVRAVVSYSNETRHKGDIYRFDGWRKAGVMRGSGGGGTYSTAKPTEAKALWVYDFPEAA